MNFTTSRAVSVIPTYGGIRIILTLNVPWLVVDTQLEIVVPVIAVTVTMIMTITVVMTIPTIVVVDSTEFHRLLRLYKRIDDSNKTTSIVGSDMDGEE